MKFMENDRNGLTPEEYEKQRKINNADMLNQWESDLIVENNKIGFDEYRNDMLSSLQPTYEQDIESTITLYKEMYQRALKSNNEKLMRECEQIVSYLESKLNCENGVKKGVK